MKGISPLIATVLLIAFTVAIGGIVSIFFTSFTKQTTGGVSSQGQNLVVCANSNPTIDKVYYALNSGNTINATFSNPGSYNVTNITIYASMPNGSTFSYGNALMYLNPLATNSALIVNGSITGQQPLEVKVSGFCQGNQPVQGSCTSGQSCMVGV